MIMNASIETIDQAVAIYWQRRYNLAYARRCKAAYAAERAANPGWVVRRKPRRHKTDARQLELPLAI